jgi:hypothetical protein
MDLQHIINCLLALHLNLDKKNEASFEVEEILNMLIHYKQEQALQLQQTGVMRCFSDDHIGVIARNIAKEYAFENEYMFNRFTEAITKGMKIGRKVIQQNNA